MSLEDVEAPEALRRANRLNDNCCGWNEYLKLAWWGLEGEYARVAVLDLDVRLLRAPTGGPDLGGGRSLQRRAGDERPVARARSLLTGHQSGCR